ncbi:AAA family ATPase [Virgisporangium aurantiacum]|uniref:ORC1/DEAH AAA+ ATPase domain-containing protein n=1 Tax=Virgisporangium aurantiacum TaxID=175570 RepID=A0A8J3ZMK9_9ACTN|nr:AAA family ATPase [Virgisporangium aurantiacum]GIJ64740.1 hypothetical protein Vau01_122560 [Virgisporangium aurantiacum]
MTSWLDLDERDDHYLGLAGAHVVATEALLTLRDNLADVLDARAMMCVHGDAGLGKTLSVNAALRALAPADVCRVQFRARPTPRDIRHVLFDALGCSGAPPMRPIEFDALLNASWPSGRGCWCAMRRSGCRDVQRRDDRRRRLDPPAQLAASTGAVCAGHFQQAHVECLHRGARCKPIGVRPEPGLNEHPTHGGDPIVIQVHPRLPVCHRACRPVREHDVRRAALTLLPVGG